MNKEDDLQNLAPRIGRYSTSLFLLVGVMTILISMWNWHYDIKPRLVNEARSNILNLASAQARSIESQFHNVIEGSDISIIYNSLNELLLLNDPTTNDYLYLGVTLEIDYDTYPAGYDLQNIEIGNTQCMHCLATEIPIYNRARTELVAIIKIFANPIFYQRLTSDILTNLILIILGIIVMLLMAWLTVRRLLNNLRDREIKLLFEISERKTIEKQLQQIAVYDQLTSLPNRYLLHAEFEKKLEESSRHKNILATLFFDLDHFKKINDLHGHETGDLLLKEVAQRVSGVTRAYDLLARFGGDEFVMIMSNISDRSDVVQVVEKIIAGFQPAFKIDDVSLQITTSVGISIFPDDGDDPSALLKNADMAMYRAKAEGRNCYQFFNERMNQDLHRSQWIEVNLQKALDENNLALHFQPHINLESGDITSCEALIRWPQLTGEYIDPEEFIAIAERTGQIRELSNWVMKTACQYLKHWRESGLKQIRVDINLSGKDIVDQGILHKVIDVLREFDLAPHQLGIEITENILLDSTDSVFDTLSELRQAGVFVAIDDFGTGYSSLNYLKRFPVSGLKIDQSFIHEAPESEKDQIIMQAIISVGHGLGLHVIAEGVETEKHYSLCKAVNCDAIQGNYISAPLPADEFAKRYLET